MPKPEQCTEEFLNFGIKSAQGSDHPAVFVRYAQRLRHTQDSRSVSPHLKQGILVKPLTHAMQLQAVQAAQITFEDYFMADLAIEPLQIVGWEGIFGTFFMVAILLPVVSVTPGEDGSGFHENTLETLHVSPWLLCPLPPSQPSWRQHILWGPLCCHSCLWPRLGCPEDCSCVHFMHAFLLPSGKKQVRGQSTLINFEPHCTLMAL